MTTTVLKFDDVARRLSGFALGLAFVAAAMLPLADAAARIIL